MGLEFFLAGWGIGFAAYSVAQVGAALTTRGRYRLICLLPLPFMLGVLAWTAYAEAMESNLWPIVMIFASPGGLIAVVVLWVYCRLDHKRVSAVHAK